MKLNKCRYCGGEEVKEGKVGDKYKIDCKATGCVMYIMAPTKKMAYRLWNGS